MKHFLISIFIFFSVSLFSQDFSSICLDNTEKEIINLINQYRAENNLPELKLSASLCYVADVHAKDLHFNNPHKNCGSMISWSNKGRWSKICYDKSKTALRDMKNKPAELTQYKGQSLELVYFGTDNYSAIDVLNDWKKHPQCNNLILNKQPYAATKWLAIGAGYFEGYLCVWFGPLEDKFNEVASCEKEIIVQEEEIVVENYEEIEELTEINNSDVSEDYENFDELENFDEFEDFDEIPDEKAIIEAKIVEEIIQEEVIIPSEQWHVIVSVATNESSANDEVNKMKRNGYSGAATIFDKDAKYQFRISAGSFINKDDAEILKSELIKKGYKDTWLLKK
ncbi:CAP domain-containing protein [Bacteroidales bacterium OttesenSCG-928-K03]|nr:CAP domain-containing protein [Bacteroidales bacterium OttesenSCG-928-K03]